MSESVWRIDYFCPPGEDSTRPWSLYHIPSDHMVRTFWTEEEAQAMAAELGEDWVRPTPDLDRYIMDELRKSGGRLGIGDG